MMLTLLIVGYLLGTIITGYNLYKQFGGISSVVISFSFMWPIMLIATIVRFIKRSVGF